MFSSYWKSLTPQQKSELAKSAGTKITYLRHIASGVHRAGPVLAKRLHELTKGEVDKHDLRPDIYD